jgi:hypothetical protein
VHRWSLRDGIGLAIASPVVNFFVAGSEVVRWELAAVGTSGDYRLSVWHSGGTIVEYFKSTAAALDREQEIEALFLAARAANPVYAS